MARKRASMREGPLAELFKATEAAQRQAEQESRGAPQEGAYPPLVKLRPQLRYHAGRQHGHGEEAAGHR